MFMYLNYRDYSVTLFFSFGQLKLSAQYTVNKTDVCWTRRIPIYSSCPQINDI